MDDGNNGNRFEHPSWSVYVIDSSRKALPHSWPLVAFQSREEARESFRNWQIIEEGFREIGFHEGYEIYGRGEHGGQEFQVRQIVVWTTEGAWLVSCVWPSKSDAAAPIEWFLQTLSFQ